MSSTVESLEKYSEQLYTQRGSLVSLWQEIADNFYVERADFTTARSLGTDFAANLTTSFPLLARRALGDSLSSMLRPPETEWFSVHTQRESVEESHEVKEYLQWITKVMRRAMYARQARFDRATKEGDHDFAAFGQCCISVELNKLKDELLYRCWHLRDMAWAENYEGKITKIYRRWEPMLCELSSMFDGKYGRNNISTDAKKRLKSNPYDRIKCKHAVFAADEYDSPTGKKFNTPFVSVYWECESRHILEEVGVRTSIYLIPRWQTVSGSQYSFSPATVCALPDARLIQAMTLTLLEAGEKAVNPPLKTPGDVLRSDIALYAGGVTSYDADYDEGTGRVLEPLYQIDKSGFGFGAELRQDVREMITRAFYLDRLNLPAPQSKEMTAFEVAQRVQEYIRNAMPIFAPMEADYNGGLCELTFETMKNAGAFGPPENMPEALRGADIQFRFKSPLHDAIEQQKGQIFLQGKGLVDATIPLDTSAAFVMDSVKALRDSLNGIGVPAKWIRDEEESANMAIEAKQAQEAQQMLALAEQGGAAAEKIGNAAESFSMAAV